MRHFSMILMATAGLALLPAQLLNADTPGRHPHYLHARADLRNAQYVLRGFAEPNVREHIHAADLEIDRAVATIDHAAVLDRKDIQDPARVDHQFNNRDRFRDAMAFLTNARHDVTAEEDNRVAVKWCDVAERHIDRAMYQVRRAARDLHLDRELGW